MTKVLNPMRVEASRLTTKERLKLCVRCIAAGTLFYSGICLLYRLLLKRKQAIILTYHRVIDPDELGDSYLQAGMYVTKQVFQKQMKYLARHYHVISLEDLIQLLRERKVLPRKTCVITFDDGWRDFYTHAFPTLKEYNLPATVFLVSGYVSTNRWFWPERVSFLMTKYLQANASSNYTLDKFPTLRRLGFFHLSDNPNLTSAQKIDTAIERMKELSQAEMEKALGELKDLLESPGMLDTNRPLLLNWDEIKQMAKSRITFGSHTRTHSILTATSEEKMIDEIAKSKEEIEEHLSAMCLAFCYPNGNYNNNIKKIVMRYYACALSTNSGHVKYGDDLFALKRVGIHNDISFTKSMFACLISKTL